MSGRLIAVVGPSGVGKDTVMAALAETAGMGLVRRAITRPAEAGGEPFEGISEDEFARREAAGAFALSWGAHGLYYGIPIGVREDLKTRDMLVNLSRKVLTRAAETFPNFLVLNLTAPVEVLAQRLAARGRETAEDIARRLAREVALPEGLTVVTLSNDGALEDTIDAARRALYVPVS